VKESRSKIDKTSQIEEKVFQHIFYFFSYKDEK